MLRWCLPTVRVSGGPGNALFNVRTWSSTRYALKSGNNARREDNVDPHPVPVNAVAFGEPPAVEQVPRYKQPHPSLTIPDTPSASSTCQPSKPCAVVDSVHTRGLAELGSRVVASPAAVSCSTAEAGVDDETGHADHPASISRLRAFLSSNSTLHHPTASLSASSIRSLYLSARANSQAHQLNASDMSVLISLFGTLSVPIRARPSRTLFMQPLVAYVSQSSSERSYWHFVVQLARDKRSMFKKLNPSDHYWMLHAQLAKVDSLIAKGSCADTATKRHLEKALDEVRSHYSSVSRLSSYPDIHGPYLHALLRQPSVPRLDEAVEVVCGLISRHNGFHPHLLDLLWEIITSRNLTVGSRNKLITCLANLVKRHSGISTRNVGAEGDSRGTQRGPYDAVDDTNYMYVGELTGALASAIRLSTRSSRPRTAPGDALSDWASSVVLSAFTSDSCPQDALFFRLVMLAIVRRPLGDSNFQKTVQELLSTAGGNLFDGHAVDWDVICMLAVLEKMLHPGHERVYSPPADANAQAEEIRDILDMLWTTWSSSCPPNSHDPLISSLIVSSFVYIAGRVGSTRLLRSCYVYRQTALALQDRFAVPRMATRCLNVEHMLACIACGYSMADVFNVVEGDVWDRSLLELIFTDAIRRVASTHAPLAHEAMIVARRMNIPLRADLVASVGLSLSTAGHHRSALAYVSDERISHPQQLWIFKSILKAFKRPRLAPHTHGVSRLFQLIADLPPSHPLLRDARRELESSLFMMSIRGHSVEVLQLIRTMRQRDPAYLSQPFLWRMFHHLVRRRLWYHARKVLKHLSRPLPRSLRSFVQRMEAMHANFKAASISGMLLSSRRYGTKWLPPPNPAFVENTMLHQHVARNPRRHARQVNRTLTLLRELVEKRNFVPDRVTINILLKGLLQWIREVDAKTVRALFDRMVRGGYPTGGLYSAESVPFGSETTESSISLPEVKSQISFTRHVRPLYKMFIKAMSVREDFASAKVVSKILRTLEVQHHHECAARRMARQVGRKRKDGKSI